MSKRTDKQNRALHLYLHQVAEALDREGHTMQNVTEAIRKAEIRPTKENIKEVVWKPLQAILLNKKSTTQLNKVDVDRVYEVMNAWLGREFHLYVPWPSEDTENNELLQAIEKSKRLNYQTDNFEPPTI